LCFNVAIMDTAPPSLHQASADIGTLATQIRNCGARATPARIRVLQLLQAAPGAMTHHDVESALGETMLDRVTLYRVLDWLVEAGLAHKNTDSSRVFRFSSAAAGEHTAHAHFSCETCGRVFCLDAAPPKPPALPDGFSLSRMEIDLRGRCANCAGGNCAGESS
jgi:Fur family ferric uptake transcriptional regulator